MRVLVRQSGATYEPDYIEKISKACIAADENIFRVFYYDCPPYNGTVKLPVSGQPYEFVGNDAWLKTLAAKDLFAVRYGVLKFRGFVPRRIPIADQSLTDADFKPAFEQKGVDMRIGLDIANFCETRAVDRIILVTNDTDCVPAMKYARIAGLQVVLMSFPKGRTAPELSRHADFIRSVPGPLKTAASPGKKAVAARSRPSRARSMAAPRRRRAAAADRRRRARLSASPSRSGFET